MGIEQFRTKRMVFGLLVISALLLTGASCSKSSNKVSRDCVEPENPYSSGSGHYAGYEWGESGKSCGGNSSSFIEGCEEFQNQYETYTNCLES